jgi:ribonuclease HI
MTIYKYAILPVITYVSEAWSISMSKRAKGKLQQIQTAFLIFITKAYKRVSNEALLAIAGIMPIEQAMQLYKDRRAISRGNATNAVIAALKKIETSTKTRGIHAKDNHASVDLSGTDGNANMIISTDGSKTENHVGASMDAVKDSKEIHINTKRMNTTGPVFQAELYGISMAIEWIQSQGKKTSSYAINVDSKASLPSIANKHTTHPIAIAIRVKTIKLRNSTSVTFHWVKGHAGLKGNETADYLAKTVVRYNTTIAYDKIPINPGKQILEDHYTKIWNAIYKNSADASHTKLYIPTIFHRLCLPLWPNFLLTQFLTNHGSFRSYLHKMNKTPSPNCNCPEKTPQMAHHLMLECS